MQLLLTLIIEKKTIKFKKKMFPYKHTKIGPTKTQTSNIIQYNSVPVNIFIYVFLIVLKMSMLAKAIIKHLMH